MEARERGETWGRNVKTGLRFRRTRNYGYFYSRKTEGTMKHSVLFVCLGNICRSPAAEGILRGLAEGRGMGADFRIDSAGIGGWHVGQLPDHRMRRCGERHGYRFDSRARQFAKADFARFDIVVAMDDENRRALLRMAAGEDDRAKIVQMADFLRRHPGQRDIPDPYYGEERDFDYVVELLEDACAGLLDELTRQ